MSILAKITAQKKLEIAALDAQALRRAADSSPAPRDFLFALKRRRFGTHPSLIAELKRASPSKGILAPHLDLFQVADIYTQNGASAISVLTDEKFFQGSLSNLRRASAATRLPCLQKDFIVEEFQLLQAGAYGADAILLIAAALSDLELRQLTSQAHALQLDVLCEVHTADELERVLDLDCEAVGVNNRDLKTFVVRLEVSLDLAPRLPAAAVRVSESGIETAEDSRLCVEHGVDCIIVSNQGGRAEESGRGTIECMPEVVEAAGGRIPVLVEGGFRRGTDIFKALALGARAVLLGRLYMWGLAVAGEEGVRDVLLNLIADFDLTMALSGYTCCRELDASALCRGDLA